MKFGLELHMQLKYEASFQTENLERRNFIYMEAVRQFNAQPPFRCCVFIRRRAAQDTILVAAVEWQIDRQPTRIA